MGRTRLHREHGSDTDTADRGAHMPDTITMPCRPELVGTARRAVKALLDATPVAENAELIISEFVTNAVLWSASRDGGTIDVVVDHNPDTNTVRLEVTDAGAVAGTDHGDPEQHGRGLVLVHGLAAKWGHVASKGKRETWWAELTW